MTLKAGEKVAESEVKLAQLDRQERKLLTAHYDDKVSEELFGEEQTRIRKERIAAKRRIEALSVDHDVALKNLAKALDLLSEETQTAYLLASPDERRLLNQGLTKRFEIKDEEVVADVEADRFAELRELGAGWNGSGSAKNKTPVSGLRASRDGCGCFAGSRSSFPESPRLDAPRPRRAFRR